jgi:hypothetical protein
MCAFTLLAVHYCAEVTQMPPTKKAVTQKARLNLTVTPLQKERLVKLNEQTDKPISSMIRRAIDAYLEIEEADLKRRK